MKQGFNFLKPQVEPPSVWTKVYDWVLGTARVILIFAEVAVIVALGIRIVVDVQAKQLDEQIANLDKIMESRQPEELKYRQLQSRILGFETAWTGTASYQEIMKEIDKELPNSATELKLSINGNLINISGQALSSELDVMESNLKTSPLLVETKLSKLETTNQDDGGIAKFTFDSKINNLAKRVLVTVIPE